MIFEQRIRFRVKCSRTELGLNQSSPSGTITSSLPGTLKENLCYQALISSSLTINDYQNRYLYKVRSKGTEQSLTSNAIDPIPGALKALEEMLS